MARSLLFDLTTSEQAMNSLSKFIGKNYVEIVRNLELNSRGMYSNDIEIYNRFIEELSINLDELSLEEIELKAIHVTTGNDNGDSFKRNGLKNLQQAIKSDTPLSKFLIKQGINIDIDNKVINYRGRRYLLKNENNQVGLQRNYVYNKLYKDYLVNGFHYNNDPLSYGGDVAYRPEFIVNIGNLIRNNNLENEWIKTFNQCYIIEYKTNPYNYEWFNYDLGYLNKEMFEENRDYYIKQWLIRQAINIIVSNMQDSVPLEIYSYTKYDYNFSSSEILNITDVTSKR